MAAGEGGEDGGELLGRQRRLLRLTADREQVDALDLGQLSTQVAELVPACTRLAVVVRGGPRRGLDAGAVATALELPLAAVVPYDDDLLLAAERGEPPARSARSGLARSCGRLLAERVPLGAVA